MRFYVNCFFNGKTIVKKYVRFLAYKPMCSAREYRKRYFDDFSLADRLNINITHKGRLKTLLAKGIFLRSMLDVTTTFISVRRLINHRLMRNKEFH